MVSLRPFLPFVVYLVFPSLLIEAKNTKLEEVFHWNLLDFDYPDDTSRSNSIESKQFIPENNLPLGLEVWNDKLFVTVPRWKSGVPSTLNYVSLSGDNKSPKLIPYPDWNSNHLPTGRTEEGNVTENGIHIISVFRVRVDACDRLWMLDTGLNDVVGEAQQLQDPRILIYDLRNDSLIHSYTLKSSHIKEDSFFANIIVDVDTNDCEGAFAYIPDLGGYSLIVYSLKGDESWRVKHHYFHFDPLNGNYSVGGVNFQWVDGVFSLALSAPHDDGFRTAYFHPLSSTNEFSVSTKVLRNKTLATDPHNFEEFKLLGSRGPHTQAGASFLDEQSSVVFYTQVNLNGVGCWNSKSKEYSPEYQHLVTSDNETFIFPNDLKVDRGSNLWVLIDRLPIFIYRGLDPESINFYIFKGSVKEIIKDTICEKN
ncbi:protein yellow isoform X2 [Cryptotermes secundus]|nr:protein yellow isoform X2 [Cryptotermes secundus]XP_023719986.1 protein yellow isoform X2 [Cryptotermes secundus]